VCGRPALAETGSGVKAFETRLFGRRARCLCVAVALLALILRSCEICVLSDIRSHDVCLPLQLRMPRAVESRVAARRIVGFPYLCVNASVRAPSSGPWRLRWHRACGTRPCAQQGRYHVTCPTCSCSEARTHPFVRLARLRRAGKPDAVRLGGG